MVLAILLLSLGVAIVLVAVLQLMLIHDKLCTTAKRRFLDEDAPRPAAFLLNWAVRWLAATPLAIGQIAVALHLMDMGLARGLMMLPLSTTSEMLAPAAVIAAFFISVSIFGRLQGGIHWDKL